MGSATKKEKKEEKALFIQRLFAFLLDVVLVSLVASLLVSPFLDTKTNSKYSEEATQIMENFTKGEITVQEYVEQYSVITYKIARNSGISSIVIIFLSVLYFVVFQIYNKGQTLGKRLAKIKIVSVEGELTMNQMIFRALLADFILLDIINFVFMLFSSKYVYFYGVTVFEVLQYLMVFASIIMVMFRSDGKAVHDKIVGTKVIKV